MTDNPATERRFGRWILTGEIITSDAILIDGYARCIAAGMFSENAAAEGESMKDLVTLDADDPMKIRDATR